MKTIGSMLVCLLGIIAISSSAKFKPNLSRDLASGPTAYKIRTKMIPQIINLGESITYLKGTRQRHENGPDSITITQCDSKRTILVFNRSEAYLVMAFGSPVIPNSVTSAIEDAEKKGNKQTVQRRIVTLTTTFTDTGERKQILGLTARHVKGTVSTEMTSDTCGSDRGIMYTETDGWYVDLPGVDLCPNGVDATTLLFDGKCMHEDRYRYLGNTRLGYPVVITYSSHMPPSVHSQTTHEATEISEVSLDDSMFEVPVGFSQVKYFGDIGTLGMKPKNNQTARGIDKTPEVNERIEPKRPGSIRIGVATVNNKVARTISTEMLRDTLLVHLTRRGFDALPMEKSATGEVESEAKQKQCDYILYSVLEEVQGGDDITKNANSNTGESARRDRQIEVRVSFRLVDPSGRLPEVMSSASAKDSGSESLVISKALQQEASLIFERLKAKN